MNTLHGLIHSKQYKNTSKAVGGTRQNEALEVFDGLTLKEKCLYLIKISKRNTGHQALVLMGLMSAVIAADYLFTMII
ncbi:MAG: hypothetical protein ACOYVK_22475 [Bacillota bacterium]